MRTRRTFRGYRIKITTWQRLAFVLCFSAFVGSVTGQMQEREGNFQIRFEPTAKLQTGAPVPFQILVKDPLRKPLPHAKVKLQIENRDGNIVETYPASETDPGTYIAKPVFRRSGDWSVYVEVNREGAVSARTMQFQVAD